MELGRLRERIATLEGEDEGANGSSAKKVKRESVVVEEDEGMDFLVVLVLN